MEELIGSVQEKGFSTQPGFSKVQLPAPRLTPFPVARHRSEPPGRLSDQKAHSVHGESQIAQDSPKGALANWSKSGSVQEDIDAQNLEAVFQMSSLEVAEAQAELQLKLQPEALALLRRRGAEKEKKRQEDKRGNSKLLAVKDYAAGHNIAGRDRTSETLSVQATEATASQNGPVTVKDEDTTVFESDPWTLRVEAVRIMRFDLDGNVNSTIPESKQVCMGVSFAAVPSAVERDILRTDGDPAAFGYTLKEAAGLARSMVSGQRNAGLRLVAAVLENALRGLQDQKCDFSAGAPSVDWQAVWAYALGPEPELVLVLRLALDDAHTTVITACAKAIQSLLSFAANETYFDSLEAFWPGDRFPCTAPVFRRHTKQDEGFIGGGRWKYNVKRSDLFPFSDSSAQINDDEDKKDTVGDDEHVANRDVAAGLIRMGVLPRIRYLLEVENLVAANEHLLSILIALARHSPNASSAVMNCPRLIDAIISRFIVRKESEEADWQAHVRTIQLLKVLSQSRKEFSMQFEELGALYPVIVPLFQYVPYTELQQVHAKGLDTLDLVSEKVLQIKRYEGLRYWRSCINYQIGISLFSDCYNSLCFWLSPFSTETLLGGNEEIFSLAQESYNLVEQLARTLPILHSKEGRVGVMQDFLSKKWSWGAAVPVLNTALGWLSPDCTSTICKLVNESVVAAGEPSKRARKVLGILASVMHFLATVCERILPKQDLRSGWNDTEFRLPWLPTFVPHVGLAVANSRFFSYQLGDSEVLLPPLTQFCFMLEACSCLHGMLRLTVVIDNLIKVARPKRHECTDISSVAHQILDVGLVLSAEIELRDLLLLGGQRVLDSRHILHSFGKRERGGPAPGVGLGWGAVNGGAWGQQLIATQAIARLTLDLLEIFQPNLCPVHLNSGQSKETSIGNETAVSPCICEAMWRDIIWRFSTGLAIVAISTPGNAEVVERVYYNVLFDSKTLTFLSQKVAYCLTAQDTLDIDDQGLNSKVDVDLRDITGDPEIVGTLLSQHCREFWLAVKSKSPGPRKNRKALSEKLYGSNVSVPGRKLETVLEDDLETPISKTNLCIEWAGQRLPLPMHWFLSPLVTNITQFQDEIHVDVVDDKQQVDKLEATVKAGLAFFLAFEVLTNTESDTLGNTITLLPLVRKVHSLSTVFALGGDVFLQFATSSLIRALQDLLGSELAGALSSNLVKVEGPKESELVNLQGSLWMETTGYVASGGVDNYMLLDFKGSIDGTYSTFAESFVEQFAAASFGDLVFARHVALHLSQNVEDSIRLATWHGLADAKILYLLPTLAQCCGGPLTYLSPVERNQQILEAYASAWAVGALNKAFSCGSLSFVVALHHLGGFLFGKRVLDVGDHLFLRKKLMRSLVRSSTRSSEQKVMLSRLVSYCHVKSLSHLENGSILEAMVGRLEWQERLQVLMDACEGDFALVCVLERLQPPRNLL